MIVQFQLRGIIWYLSVFEITSTENPPGLWPGWDQFFICFPPFYLPLYEQNPTKIPLRDRDGDRDEVITETLFSVSVHRVQSLFVSVFVFVFVFVISSSSYRDFVSVPFLNYTICDQWNDRNVKHSLFYKPFRNSFIFYPLDAAFYAPFINICLYSLL